MLQSNPITLIKFILCCLLALAGLICTVLERRGILKPVTRRTGNRISHFSGGVLVLVAGILGINLLLPHSLLYCICYALILAAAYLAIRLFVPKGE